MKILVTGADGFIGSHLVEKLVLDGQNVKALVLYNSLNSIGWLNHISFKNLRKINICSGDIKDQNYLEKIFTNVDIVFHLAALISIPYSYLSPKSYLENNILGTFNVLEAALKKKISLVVHTSTSEVYGSAQYVPIDEKHPLVGQSPYAASKIACDQLAMSYFRSYDLPVTIIRPFNTFGPRQSTRAVIPTIINQFLINRNKIYLGNTKPTRDFSYIEDTISAFVSILKNKKKVIGEIINIGSGYEISIQNIFNIIKNKFNDKKIFTDKIKLRPNNSEVYRLKACNKKAKKLLNWKPKYFGLDGLNVALDKTIDWYKVNNSKINHKKLHI